MNEIDILLGKSIAEQRRRLTISQEELAGRVGLAPQTIAAFEQGTRRATAKQLFEIADVLGVQIEGFFGGLDGELSETPATSTPFAPETDDLTAYYGALSKTHRTAIFAFLLALKRDQEENSGHLS